MDIKVVHTREQQSLVEADFESFGSDTAGPHIDDLFESSRVDRQFHSWYTSHGLHKAHINASANGFLVVDDNSSILEFVCPQGTSVGTIVLDKCILSSVSSCCDLSEGEEEVFIFTFLFGIL